MVRKGTGWLCAALLLGCGDAGAPASADVTSSGTGSSGDEGSSSTGEPEPPPPWEPGVVYPQPPEVNPRGFLDVRGLIHSHSPYSHDACDGEPLIDGQIDPVCYDDLREGLCRVQHDFVMLTDHRESFSDFEFPEVLLYDEARGDELVQRGDAPVANWAACEGVRPTLILAGCESGLMPVGLESHVPGRSDVYGEASADAIGLYDQHGALSLVSHTEDWEVEQLTGLPLHGFEMYNVHANMLSNLAGAAELISRLQMGGDGLPHPDLSLFPIYQEDERYLTRWGSVLASGTKRVTVMATDAHRNTFTQLLSDGERVDSFRRMMQWFSNHVLVRPDVVDGEPQWDDMHLKDAVRAGRLYGVFEYLGYAEGFDAYVQTRDGTLVEIGGTVALADSPEIVAVAPSVRSLPEGTAAPTVTLHVMRAIDGGFEEVDGGGSIAYAPDAAGAYRVEVRITPSHITDFLGAYADAAAQPRVWVYANPFYVE